MIYIAENLRFLRKKLNMTQEDVADTVFVASQTISKWERGETTPDIEMLPTLAKLFGTSVDSLLGMDRIYSDEAKRDIFRIAHEHYERGEYAEAAQVHREGLSRFPNDDGMLSELALSLAMLPDGLEEAIRICERILAGSGSEKIKHTVRAALCLMLQMNGDTAAAKRLAGTLPHVRESREEIHAALDRCNIPGENERYLRFLTLGKY